MVYPFIVSECRTAAEKLKGSAPGPNVALASCMKPRSNGDGHRKLKYLNETVHHCYVLTTYPKRSDLGYNPCFWEMLN